MLKLISKKTFKGGVHPKEFKELTEHKVLEKFPEPDELVIPLSQHSGKDAIPLVKKNDKVKVGTLIAKEDGFISAPIHSPICGTVTSITKTFTFAGIQKSSIILKKDGLDEKDFLPPLDFETVSSEEIISRVKEAGIVGLGGAAFPTYVKLIPPPDKKIDMIILNACECEPYLTRDYRLVVERTEDLIKGLKLIMRASKVQRGIIGIEDNKQEAIELLKEHLVNHSEIELVVLKTKYPQGAEKMLIKAATGREVPPGKLPLDVGVIVQNVGTAISIFDAVVNGIPSIYAYLTVSGLGINEPKNLIVPIGTSIEDVIEYCGGMKENVRRIVIGGPMMGYAQFDLSTPITKAVSGILFLTDEELEVFPETNCLRCGMCVSVCPLNLTPVRLVRLIQNKRFEEAAILNVALCMECGTCAYSCPASIPLVQWLRLGKKWVFQNRFN
ncbi:MAG: electron transport complex subunit RsxC [Ignavibacteria bacterium]|nr:electron transport complex subunit RsxC [Ignavibacteria bacterium]